MHTISKKVFLGFIISFFWSQVECAPEEAIHPLMQDLDYHLEEKNDEAWRKKHDYQQFKNAALYRLGLSKSVNPSNEEIEKAYNTQLEKHRSNPYDNPHEIPEDLTHSKNLLLDDAAQRAKEIQVERSNAAKQVAQRERALAIQKEETENSRPLIDKELSEMTPDKFNDLSETRRTQFVEWLATQIDLKQLLTEQSAEIKEKLKILEKATNILTGDSEANKYKTNLLETITL
jgi:hypothetical protein